jgi:adenylate cyclase, class 2
MANLARNLELKVSCSDLSWAREKVHQLGAGPATLEVQTDTYFRVPHGRLKLREIEGRPAVLIWYERPDCPGVRTSAYHLVPVTDAALLRAALAGALGLRGQVQKRREIYLWHNVRVHLDEVAGLGTFIEFEAVMSGAGDEPTSQARLHQLCAALGIDPAGALAPSYADLLGI